MSVLSLVVWSVHGSPTEADYALDLWKAESEQLSGVVALADGWPRVVQVGDQHAVALGRCQQSDPVRALTALVPARLEPTSGDPACPTWVDGPWTLDPPVVQPVGALSLTVAHLRRPGAGEPFGGLEATGVLRASLRTADGARRGGFELATQVGPFPGDAQTVEKVTAVEGGIDIVETRTHGVGAYCNRYPGFRHTHQLRVVDGRLAVQTTDRSEWEIDIDSECAE